MFPAFEILSTHCSLDPPLLYRLPASSAPLSLVYPPRHVTAVTAMARLVPEAAEPEAHEWVPHNPDVNRRLHAFHRHADNTSLTFSVTCIPGSVRLMRFRNDSGTPGTIRVLSHALPQSSALAPITVWLLGRVMRDFVVSDGDQDLSLKFEPLSRTAHETAHALLWFFSSSGFYTSDPATLPELDLSRPIYDQHRVRIWDAREKLLSPRPEMSQLPHVRKGAIVLVETWLVRRQVPYEGEDITGWKSSYHLRSVCLLHAESDVQAS